MTSRSFALRVPPRPSLVDQRQSGGYFLRQQDRAYFPGSKSRSPDRFGDSRGVADRGHLDPPGTADLLGPRQTFSRDDDLRVDFGRNQNLAVKLRHQLKAVNPRQRDERRRVGNDFHNPRRSMVCQSS